MSPRVNYLIAACSYRVGQNSMFSGKDVLHAHLRELRRVGTHDLAQVTILRTLPLVRNGNLTTECDHYWDVDLGEFGCPVETLDVEDRCFSYSSWPQAIMRWGQEFDYYVLMEDDYYPAHSRFVEILLAEHKRKLPSGGLLCGFATDHAASSNGIVDSATFVRCLGQLSDPLGACMGQKDFARTFCDDQVADYTDRYRCLFPLSDEIVELVHGDDNGRPLHAGAEDLIRPIEYLVTGEQAFRKSILSSPRSA